MILWILSEERPKLHTISSILRMYAKHNDSEIICTNNHIIIDPVFYYGVFVFTYKVMGISIVGVDEIILKIVSGKSSFVDYLIYEGGYSLPNMQDSPVLAIEETKTTDKESRNTTIFQRLTKFVYIDFYYPKTKKIMFYNLQTLEQLKVTNTNKFGIRLLLTLGVLIEGKSFDQNLTKFQSLEDIVKARQQIKKPPAGNIPLTIQIINSSLIYISGRLVKNNRIAHDPNIGAVLGICKALRMLKFNGSIEVINHGLSQEHIANDKGKFIKAATQLNINLLGLSYIKAELGKLYWDYDVTSEKNASILLHILCESIDGLFCIYENHAGSERGYLIDIDQHPIVVPKYPRSNKSSNEIISLPDLVVLDRKNHEINIMEAKISTKLKEAEIDLINLKNFIEFVRTYYSDYKFNKGIILFGKFQSSENIFFVLSQEGEVNLAQNKAKFLGYVKDHINSLNNKYTGSQINIIHIKNI